MKVFDKIKGLFIETDEEEMDMPVEETPPKKTSTPLTPSTKISPIAPSNIVNFNNPHNIKVVIVEPAKFDDAQKIADCLRDDQPVIINFEKTDIDIIKRITDFIAGTIYAIDGSIQNVGSDILLCAPKGVDISANGLNAFNKKPELSGFNKEFTPWKEK